ncbi:MAG: serine/threonine-protein kinase, partial [Planctomycetota bacterium]
MKDALSMPQVESQRLSAVMADLSSNKIAFGSSASRDFTFAEVQPWINETSRGNIGRFADYDLIECVGRGGMGIVFRGFDASLDRSVAVKLMMPALANDHEAKQRFFREARSIAAVRHPNVVAVHAVAEQDGLPYLVTEFIEGQSLQQRVHPTSRLDAEQIQRLGAEIAAGLDACHQAGVVHRDIKPSNVLVESRTGTAKITDFGLATIASSPSLTMPGHLAGTPGYLAPERLAGMASDERSDLFSLGCVLYALAAGVEPFQSDSPFATMHQISECAPKPIRELNPEIPKGLANMIESLMAKRPEDRPQTAAETRNLLLKPAGAGSRSSTEGSRRKQLAWMLPVALLIVAAVVVSPLIFRSITGTSVMRSSDGVFFVSNDEELREAVRLSQDGDIIEIEVDDLLRTEGLEIVGKSITLRAMDEELATLSLLDDGSRPIPILSVRDCKVELFGITLEGDVTESDEFPLVTVERASLVATGCRFENNSPGVCINIEGGTESTFNDCSFFALEGAGIRWETNEEDTLQIHSCLHVGETGFLILCHGNASFTWTDSNALVSNSLCEFDHNDGELSIEARECRAQAEDYLILVNAEELEVVQFKEQLQWRGESNRLF